VHFGWIFEKIGFRFPLLKKKKYIVEVRGISRLESCPLDSRSEMMGAVKMNHHDPLLESVVWTAGVPGHLYTRDKDADWSMPTPKKIRAFLNASAACVVSLQNWTYYVILAALYWVVKSTTRDARGPNGLTRHQAFYSWADEYKRKNIRFLATFIDWYMQFCQLIFFYKPLGRRYDAERTMIISRELLAQYAVPMLSLNFADEAEVARKMKRFITQLQTVNIDRYMVDEDIYWNTAEVAIALKRSQVLNSRSRSGFSVLNF
jgi:hypothetical protein